MHDRFRPAPAPEIPGWMHHSSGKVRDVYIPAPDGPWAGQNVLLVVASDRISAYDHILATPIPDKGKVLTALSAWWFEQLADIIPNHLVSLDVPAAVAGRAMVCRRLTMYPVECVARGYLTGSGLVEYRENQSVCGIPLLGGLREASRLADPIFTPAAKAALGDHDENVSFERVADMVGPQAAASLREATLDLYSRAADIARERGIILADTKFEFGAGPDGELVLGDEVLTPDSSRFWPADQHQREASQDAGDSMGAERCCDGRRKRQNDDQSSDDEEDDEPRTGAEGPRDSRLRGGLARLIRGAERGHRSLTPPAACR